MIVTIRVGEGQTPSGKIIDTSTKWYAYEPETGIDERMDAICYAITTGKNTYISVNRRKYQLISIERLMRYGKKEERRRNT